MGVTVGVLCSACANETLELSVHRTASQLEVSEVDSFSRGERATAPWTKGDLSRPETSVREDISRRASAASTAADLPQQQSREAASETSDVSASSNMDVRDGWADWTVAATLCEVAATLCENYHQPPAVQQQFRSEETNLGSLAPDVPAALPRFASLEPPQPSWIIAARSPSALPPQLRSVGTQAPEDKQLDLAPTVHTSIGEQQPPQQESQQELQQELLQELQQEPVQELLPLPDSAWPLLPSVGTWLVRRHNPTLPCCPTSPPLTTPTPDPATSPPKHHTVVPHLLQTRSHSAGMATEADTAQAWHALPSVGTWLHQPLRHCRKGNHSATTAPFLLHAKKLGGGGAGC